MPTSNSLVDDAQARPDERDASHDAPPARAESRSVLGDRERTPSGTIDSFRTGKFHGIVDSDDPARTGEFAAAPPSVSVHPLAAVDYDDLEIIRPIGSGGIAELWQARHAAVEDDFVVKVARESLADNPHVRRQFDREWRATRLLEHPGIIDHHSRGETSDGRSYLTMDLVVGRSLTHFVKRPVSWRFLRAALAQLCDVLTYTHRRGVLHQDLKPSNILIDLEERRLRLTDFGLAHFGQSERNARTRSVLGTPSYMAPEQARGQLGWLGPHTDLYTVGVMLFELLAGQKPFEDDDDRVVMIKHCTCPPPELDIRDGIDAPDGVRDLVQKLLAKAPDARFENAAALKSTLAEL